MGHAYTSLAFLGLIWLFSLVCGLVPILGGRREPLRGFWRRVCFALGAIGLGCLGMWPPFSLWPRLEYSWTNGASSVTIDFSWFYVVPLVLGVVGLALLVQRRRKAPAGTLS